MSEGIRLIETKHLLARVSRRVPNCRLPQGGCNVRVIAAKDVLRGSEILLVRVRGGVLLGRWQKGRKIKNLSLVTALDEKTFKRLQRKPRYMPVHTTTYKVLGVLTARDTVGQPTEEENG